MSVLLALGSGVPRGTVQAQAPLDLYDGFHDPRIDPDRWFGLDSGVTAEQIRQVRGNALNLASRVYSDPADFGRVGVSGVRFTHPTAVTAMAAEFRVMEVEASSCSATRARATVSMSGSFFNGRGGTTPGNRTGDVRAGVTISRNSDSTDSQRMLRATAFVAQCGNADCSISTTLAGTFVDFGTLALDRRAHARVEWEADNDRFVFQFGTGDPVFVGYADVPSVSLPEQTAGLDEKAIQVRNTVAGCAGDRSVAQLDVLVDDVYVNAAP